MNGSAVWDQPLMSSVMWREWCRREVSIRMMTLQHRLSPSIEQWCLHHNTVWHMVGIVHCWNQWILMFLVFHVKRTAGQIANESICKGGLAPSTWFGLSTTELWEHQWWFWRHPRILSMLVLSSAFLCNAWLSLMLNLCYQNSLLGNYWANENII